LDQQICRTMASSPQTPELARALPNWMRWGGAGLTALVAVLFVVLLLQVREQGQRLQTLQNRLQTLENANDLGRTNALEEQLRSTVQRLQRLETLDTTVQALSREQEALRQQISSRPELSLPPADAGLLPAPTPAKPKAPPQPLSPE
jgi:uncharacterized protein HemX